MEGIQRRKAYDRNRNVIEDRAMVSRRMNMTGLNIGEAFYVFRLSTSLCRLRDLLDNKNLGTIISCSQRRPRRAAARYTRSIHPCQVGPRTNRCHLKQYLFLISNSVHWASDWVAANRSYRNRYTTSDQRTATTREGQRQIIGIPTFKRSSVLSPSRSSSS